MIQIPKELLQEWLADPTTRKVMESIGKVQDAYRSVLNDGGTLDTASSDKTALQTALLLGKIAGINVLLNIAVNEEE